MAHDGAITADVDVSELFERPSNTALKRIAGDLNLNKVLRWDRIDALEQFYALVEKPPLHSVVAEISPAVAKYILAKMNTKNRPMQHHHWGRIGYQITNNIFELTGDTIKFSESGRLLDGQHRLEAAAKSNRTLKTHVVFGLDEAIFDVVDQGKKRSPSDVLTLCGVKNASIVAGAIRQFLLFSSGTKGNDLKTLSARRIRELALGDMKDIVEYANDGALVREAFGHPPSMITAILYMIGKHSKAAAKGFAHDWVHGARIGRNENFDVLSGRLMQIERQSGGHINRHVRAALIITTFNHWYADIVAKPRALTWRKEWIFPELEFNKQSFLKKIKDGELFDTSLAAHMDKLLIALGKAALKAKDGNVTMSTSEWETKSGVPNKQVGSVFMEMERKGYVHCSRRVGSGGPAVWRLKDPGLNQLKIALKNNNASLA